MTIYISGPITGIPDRNKKMFQMAQSEIAFLCKGIKREKVKIINPVKLGLKLDEVFARNGKEPTWEDYMRACIKELCGATYLLSMTNWANSEGATLERYIAKRLNIPIAENIKELSELITGGLK